jgi:hypothetical protein
MLGITAVSWECVSAGLDVSVVIKTEEGKGVIGVEVTMLTSSDPVTVTVESIVELSSTSPFTIEEEVLVDKLLSEELCAAVPEEAEPPPPHPERKKIALLNVKICFILVTGFIVFTFV